MTKIRYRTKIGVWWCALLSRWIRRQFPLVIKAISLSGRLLQTQQLAPERNRLIDGKKTFVIVEEQRSVFQNGTTSPVQMKSTNIERPNCVHCVSVRFDCLKPHSHEIPLLFVFRRGQRRKCQMRVNRKYEMCKDVGFYI